MLRAFGTTGLAGLGSRVFPLRAARASGSAGFLGYPVAAAGRAGAVARTAGRSAITCTCRTSPTAWSRCSTAMCEGAVNVSSGQATPCAISCLTIGRLCWTARFDSARGDSGAGQRRAPGRRRQRAFACRARLDSRTSSWSRVCEHTIDWWRATAGRREFSNERFLCHRHRHGGLRRRAPAARGGRAAGACSTSEPHYGGHTASFVFEGKFTFDEGPHVSFTKHERLQKLFADSIDNKYETLHTKVNNYWKGHWIKHPAQVNLYGLPTDLIVNVIKDFVAAQHTRSRRDHELRAMAARQFRRHLRRDLPDGIHDQVPHH